MTKKIFTTILIAAFFSSYSFAKNCILLNQDYTSDRFELIVSDYLNEDGLFTLTLKDNEGQYSGKADVYVLMKSINGSTVYSEKIYSVDDPVGMIDDNSLTLDENGNYMIYNQGKGYGYSEEENVIFFPHYLKQGTYNFQVMIELDDGEKIYSNILRIDLPIVGIE